MKLIIPAIDIYNGKVVRLTRGDFSQSTIYSDDPLELVKFFKNKGFKRVHIVDLEGAKVGEVKLVNLISQIKSNYPDVIIQFGGGIRSYSIAKEILKAGADFIIIGTMFIKKPEEFQRILSEDREKVILSLDINIDRVVIYGWQSESNLTVDEAFEKALRMGIVRIMSTDITRDGTLLGPDIRFVTNLLETIKKKYFDILAEEILKMENSEEVIREVMEIMKRDTEEFMRTLKNPLSGNYELRQKLEEHDRNIEEIKEKIKEKISLQLEDLFQRYPKPKLIISGGISSDSDIQEIFKLDNSFLEGIIVGKSLYEGRLSIFR
ncbi:MAG: geranylgeranylglyceryl/heptaprenylglyceryl phosphate synthase [Brevinematia bacterium]